ncbi:MAG: hypothetical protein IT479_13350 [Xanthomonadales bacterium]|nr:hypothetical protein [Xanthomonadales bacterium]
MSIRTTIHCAALAIACCLTLAAIQAFADVGGSTLTSDPVTVSVLTTADRVATMTPQALMALISIGLTVALVKKDSGLQKLTMLLVELQTKSVMNQEAIAKHMNDTNNLLRSILDEQKEIDRKVTAP